MKPCRGVEALREVREKGRFTCLASGRVRDAAPFWMEEQDSREKTRVHRFDAADSKTAATAAHAAATRHCLLDRRHTTRAAPRVRRVNPRMEGPSRSATRGVLVRRLPLKAVPAPLCRPFRSFPPTTLHATR